MDYLWLYCTDTYFCTYIYIYIYILYIYIIHYVVYMYIIYIMLYIYIILYIYTHYIICIYFILYYIYDTLYYIYNIIYILYIVYYVYIMYYLLYYIILYYIILYYIILYYIILYYIILCIYSYLARQHHVIFLKLRRFPARRRLLIRWGKWCTSRLGPVQGVLCALRSKWKAATTGTLKSCWSMDQYLLIPFLGGWTSIAILMWTTGVQGFDTLPCWSN